MFPYRPQELKITTESRTAEQIINQVPAIDIHDFRASLRDMMDGYFLQCEGDNPAPVYSAYIVADSLMADIYEYRKEKEQLSKVV